MFKQFYKILHFIESIFDLSIRQKTCIYLGLMKMTSVSTSMHRWFPNTIPEPPLKAATFPPPFPAQNAGAALLWIWQCCLGIVSDFLDDVVKTAATFSHHPSFGEGRGKNAGSCETVDRIRFASNGRVKDERPKEVLCMTKPDVACYCKRVEKRKEEES